MQAERVVYDAFSSADFVEKLVSFLSLEENNGKDRFDRQKFTLFKVRGELWLRHKLWVWSSGDHV